MKSVTVVAPAKLNLTLDITGVGPEGYHMMDMVMQSVNLYESIKLKKSSELRLLLPGSNVSAGPHNIAMQAAVLFFKETGLLAGAEMVVQKKVPVRAGMAGGSADAAAVLVGLNLLYEAGLSQEELCRMGAKLGADVPFAIVGGTARVTGVGDVLQPLPACPTCFFVVCMPEVGISTPKAFARYDTMGSTVHPDAAAAQAAIEAGDLHALCGAMGNAFMESSESKHNAPICASLRKNGALAALMTGSGAAVFGVFETKEAAEKAHGILQKKYTSCWLLHPTGRGAHVLTRPHRMGHSGKKKLR